MSCTGLWGATNVVLGEDLVPAGTTLATRYRCSHSGPLHFAQNVACLHEFQDFVPRGYYGCNNKDVRSSATSEKQGLTPWWPSQFQVEFVDEGETFVEGC